MHPDLYTAGINVLKKLHERKTKPENEVLPLWNTPFSGVSIIGNRTTPLHRDMQTRHQWYDLLASVGPYTGASMVLEDVKIVFANPPGSLTAICGSTLRHAVHDFQGERVCYAYFMRESVHASQAVQAPSWMHVNQYI